VVHPTASIHPRATLTDLVIVDGGAAIAPGAVIDGPAYIGAGAEVGPNCHIHSGSYVGPGSAVGQGAEVKASILLSGVKLFHFGYIGHSLVGHGANLAAGFVTSVRRFDSAPVAFRFPDCEVSVGPKGGALIGDAVQTGVYVVVLPGRQIAPGLIVEPRTVIRRNPAAMTEDGGSASVGRRRGALQQWQSLLQIWDGEADRYWSRNTVFLLLNGGLVAILATGSPSPYVAMVVCIGGVASSLIWHRANTIAKYYIDRWKVPLRRLEAHLDVQALHIIDRTAESDAVPLRYHSSSTYMQRIVRLSTAFWIVLLLLFAVKETRRYADRNTQLSSKAVVAPPLPLASDSGSARALRDSTSAVHSDSTRQRH